MKRGTGNFLATLTNIANKEQDFGDV